MKKIALLSHRGGNIGHDFMAVGMEVALTEAFGSELSIDHFEQHRHFDVYPQHHWLRLIDKLPHGRLRFIRRYLNSKSMRNKFWPQTLPLDYDLAVACGGPNIVPGGSKAVELGLMLHHMNGAFQYRGVPLIDAGVGASFPLEHVPDELEDIADKEFYKTAIGFCKQISVRDTTAQTIVQKLGFSPLLIPCAAIATGRIFETAKQDNNESGKYVIINFQRYGANTDWKQGVDPQAWMQTMQTVIADLEKRHQIMLLAHNGYERTLAKQLAPHLSCVLPTTTAEYAHIITKAKVGIVSRIHAAIPLAGIGIPSVVIGTDTRLGTVGQMGLPISYVKQASTQWILSKLEALINNASKEHERLIALRENTIGQYAKLFRQYTKEGRE